MDCVLINLQAGRCGKSLVRCGMQFEKTGISLEESEFAKFPRLMGKGHVGLPFRILRTVSYSGPLFRSCSPGWTLNSTPVRSDFVRSWTAATLWPRPHCFHALNAAGSGLPPTLRAP